MQSSKRTSNLAFLYFYRAIWLQMHQHSHQE